MYSNNILNFQKSTTIVNTCPKKSGNLLNTPPEDSRYASVTRLMRTYLNQLCADMNEVWTISREGWIIGKDGQRERERESERESGKYVLPARLDDYKLNSTNPFFFMVGFSI